MGDIMFDKARHIAAQSKIDAARITQASGNEKRGAISSLEQFSQSLSNQHKMDAAGADITAISENIARNVDQATYGKLGQRVAAAEELGASVAQAGAAGMGGSSIDAYNQTLRLAQAGAEEQGDRSVNSAVIGEGRRQGATLINGVGSLDNSVNRADQDVTQFVDDHAMGTFQKAFTFAAAAAATYVAGPQAGMAVMDMSASTVKAKNGDYAGATQSFSRGLSEGVAAGKAHADAMSGGGSESSNWGDDAFKSVKGIFNSIKLK